MPLDRNTVIAGPAIITFDSYTYYSEGDIIVESTRETWKPKTSIYGELTSRAKSQPVTKISFTPVGAMESPDKYITRYNPADIGTFIFSGADKPVAIKGKDGKISTWQAGAVTKQPVLRLSTQRTCWGPMEISCINANSTDLTSASGQNIITSVAFSDTSFNSALVTSTPYLAALGALGSPFDAIYAEDGFEVDQQATTTPQNIDNYGTINWRITEVAATVKFIPANCDVADLHTLFQLQGTDAVKPGEDVAKLNNNLVITGGVTPTALTVTLNACGPEKTTERYSLTELRAGEVILYAKKTVSAGVLSPLLTVTIA
jgi:hypothetical protein